LVLTGLGSSRYAARLVEASFGATVASTVVEYASTGSPVEPQEGLGLIVISASGRTREVLEAARRHRGVSRVIAITNHEDSPLAKEADVVLPLFAGEERSGVATRTFRATLAVLGTLSLHWLVGSGHSDEILGRCAAALSAAIAAKDEWLPETCDRLDGAAAIDVLAGAGDLGLAEQAALMLREGPRLPAVAHETGDWLHTAVYLALPGHRALLFAGAEADDEVSRTIARRGGETIVVGPLVEDAAQSIDVGTFGGLESAIVRSVVAELLAAELWRRTDAVEQAG
jgi:fructoselysine-6-P-deglycase FrlB-like protein